MRTKIQVEFTSVKDSSEELPETEYENLFFKDIILNHISYIVSFSMD